MSRQRGTGPGRSQLRRSGVGRRQPRRTVTVYCEGSTTERQYLEMLRGLPAVRRAVALEIVRPGRHGAGGPQAMVERAVAERQDRDDQDDEVWCVFDVECPVQHPSLQQAVELATRKNIHLAISNPCFEIWLILHLTDHTRWLTNTDAIALRAQLDGSTGKEVDAACYGTPERLAAAIHRARALAAMHRGNGTTFPADNPSSGMSELLAACGLAPPGGVRSGVSRPRPGPPTLPGL
ncbi:RloB family protein [Aciditerrimonas ferrireducens]|uniref:RloB family protein n=1 Tax=Aciditerrimonas ferrireducens TaxID=667306 RepID=A0ABV6C599_9ACTN